ncbi:uncharacterized protein LOC123542948 [Mercenaria mercenaria]|uniref:uncharacterized protein LOC123542948 n=1 Tax=Mercenaria mercenaria TaxID=6596 RepID=UPI00234FB3CA|nr:uncharacterized protein LOC123542948 [Mercenaria mercenaria]
MITCKFELHLTLNMCLRFVFFVVVTGVATAHQATSCYESDSDLCDAEMPVIPYLASRDPTVLITNATSNWTFCDVFAINITTWYKSIYPMSTTCPSMYSCGTKFPIWMNGRNPDTYEGLVNRTSCLEWYDNCCLHTYNFTVVNCGYFFGYCFDEPPTSCHQRYCFDAKKSGPVTNINYTPTLSNASSQTSSASPGLHVSTVGTDTSSTSLQSTDQITSHTTTGRENVAGTKIGEDNSMTALLLVCLGLVTAVILVLVTVIIRRKRLSKASDRVDDNQESIEPVRRHINECDYDTANSSNSC